ncbi:MAG: FliH/SctL family protein [Chitinivibrionales bacterium]|nr:FliH/SctL family protein [Chitinivibrionales bacterium]
MDLNSLSSQEVSTLIDRLLKEKDPATVGLRRILHHKAEEGKAFPVKTYAYQELDVPGKTRRLFSEEEQHVLALEKKVADLQMDLRTLDAQSKEQVAAAFNQGLQKGIAQGKEEGFKKAAADYLAQLAQIRTQLTAICTRIEMARKSIFANASHLLLRLSCELAKKIIQTEVSASPAIIGGVIKKALSFVGDREKIVIRIAPLDLQTVEQSRDFWMPVMERLGSIVIEPDERIERGGCIVESNSGVADARLGVQFEELSSILEKIWQTTAAAPEESEPAPEKNSDVTADLAPKP